MPARTAGLRQHELQIPWRRPRPPHCGPDALPPPSRVKPAQPLSELWGLQMLPSLPPPARAIPRPVEGTLDLGGGELLETSGGLQARVVGGPGRGPRAAELEQYALAILSERYRSAGAAGPVMRTAYYRLRRLLPRGVQIALRRWHARFRKPAWLEWPTDGVWVALAEARLALAIAEEGVVEILRLWPEQFESAAVLTHDVEGAAGQARCLAVAQLEERYGFRSCFNVVAERYPVDAGIMGELRDRGHEIGLHGIKHDGLKFSSRRVFEERLVAMRHYAAAWGVEGFRSPATHRRWEWMPDLPFRYDSSYPDTDPYEPIPGGCGTPWPFALGDLIELPITLPQDHTAWEILQRSALELWQEKLAWLRRVRGLATIIVHPDYLTDPGRWAEYEAFLAQLSELDDLWVALPREIARWWRERRARRPVRLYRDDTAWRLRFE